MKLNFGPRLLYSLAALVWLVSSCNPAPPNLPSSGPADIRRDATVEAVEKVIPSVVNIATSTDFNKHRVNIGPYRYEIRTPSGEKLNSIGSGVILEQVGDEVYILTNLHVVSDATRIHVQLADGEVYEAQQLALKFKKDLALLKIRVKAGSTPLHGVRFAGDEDLMLGETVIAVGNAFGLGGSVSRGILSSKNRRPASGDSQLDISDWLQTDADINPGNSGGPLINLNGEVIGMNVAASENKEGPGLRFAIPVTQISSALSDFFTLEFTSDLWLGATFRGTRLPLTVRFVQKGSPADRAGLKPGQEVLEVNGKAITGLVKFNSLVAGSTDLRARFTVLDGGRRRELEATLVPLIELLRETLYGRLGLKTEKLTATNSAGLILKPNEGLMVGEVQEKSPGAAVGLQTGFVIVGVDGLPLTKLADVAQTLGNKKPGVPVTLSLLVPQVGGGNVVGYQTATATLQAR